MSNKSFGFGTQIRKSPYFDSTVKWGATGFSVYNHMYIPRDFGDPEQNFWNLIQTAILCDVAVERQVEITMEIMKKAWTCETFSYQGRFYSFDNVRLEPKPVLLDCILLDKKMLILVFQF